jgi:hypothetical protein
LGSLPLNHLRHPPPPPPPPHHTHTHTVLLIVLPSITHHRLDDLRPDAALAGEVCDLDKTIQAKYHVLAESQKRASPQLPRQEFRKKQKTKPGVARAFW